MEIKYKKTKETRWTLRWGSAYEGSYHLSSLRTGVGEIVKEKRLDGSFLLVFFFFFFFFLINNLD